MLINMLTIGFLMIVTENYVTVMRLCAYNDNKM